MVDIEIMDEEEEVKTIVDKPVVADTPKRNYKPRHPKPKLTLLSAGEVQKLIREYKGYDRRIIRIRRILNPKKDNGNVNFQRIISEDTITTVLEVMKAWREALPK